MAIRRIKMDERRKYPRISSNFALDVKPSASGSATAQNLGKGGCLFEHDGPIDVGQVLDLTLSVPPLTGNVAVKGKVVRCEPASSGNQYNIAVQFMDLDEEAETDITRMLESF